jgi:hypothetical protein
MYLLLRLDRIYELTIKIALYSCTCFGINAFPINFTL